MKTGLMSRATGGEGRESVRVAWHIHRRRRGLLAASFSLQRLITDRRRITGNAVKNGAERRLPWAKLASSSWAEGGADSFNFSAAACRPLHVSRMCSTRRRDFSSCSTEPEVDTEMASRRKSAGCGREELAPVSSKDCEESAHVVAFVANLSCLRKRRENRRARTRVGRHPALGQQ